MLTTQGCTGLTREEREEIPCQRSRGVLDWQEASFEAPYETLYKGPCSRFCFILRYGFYYFCFRRVFIVHVSFLDSALKFPQEPKRKESASHPSLPDRESVTGESKKSRKGEY